ncbi:hypothetical protein DL771_008357 [Monosporascus sp. 5C6A]|nr:hypothetical protein DL771_008357 [Monosporascus sp. 5C6A]
MSLARRPRLLLCLRCQWRSFSTSYRRLAQIDAPKAAASKATGATTTTTTTPPTRPAAKVVPPSPLEHAPRSYGKRLEEFTPTPLSRPIGLPYPPEPGQNTGVDNRTLKQRRDDFVNYEKHLERREQLYGYQNPLNEGVSPPGNRKSKFACPYFRDWGNMKFHKGKTFVAPPRLFRAEPSLYFPNLYGQTLLKEGGPRDTTPALRGRVSVVSMFSSAWAEDQAASFASAEANPALGALLAAHADRAQRVWLNVEEDPLKAWLIRLFLGRLRRRVGEPNWGRYFIVRRGVSDEIREAIGCLNSKVGYTYLLDGECRIRWAGSGPSEDHEREGLVKAVRRLLDEEKASRES